MNIVLCYICFDEKLLLIKRENEPYRGYHALIGGKVEDNETLEHAAIREVFEECGLVASGATLVAKSSEKIVDSATGCTVLEYDMSLMIIDADCSKTMSSNEGELSWMNKYDFIKSCEVVPTDIDLVKKYIDNYSEDIVHYVVEKGGAGRYSILSIDSVQNKD